MTAAPQFPAVTIHDERGDLRGLLPGARRMSGGGDAQGCAGVVPGGAHVTRAAYLGEG